MTEATLYLVATPIGNLQDITERAKQVLCEVDLILAEDTRHSGALLAHLGSKVNALALHDHNERQQLQFVLSQLEAGKSLALISDAGTPLISDPGYHLVNAVYDAGFKVTACPGPCALITALTLSGMATDRFSFEGFLPAKATARGKVLEALANDPRTLVFYESPHRIMDTLAQIHEVLGDRPMAAVRELTKTFETVLRGNAASILEQMQQDSNQSRGEFVLVIGGYQHQEGEAAALQGEAVLKILAKELPTKQAAALTAQLVGGRKKEWYQKALELDK